MSLLVAPHCFTLLFSRPLFFHQSSCLFAVTSSITAFRQTGQPEPGQASRSNLTYDPQPPPPPAATLYHRAPAIHSPHRSKPDCAGCSSSERLGATRSVVSVCHGKDVSSVAIVATGDQENVPQVAILLLFLGNASHLKHPLSFRHTWSNLESVILASKDPPTNRTGLSRFILKV